MSNPRIMVLGASTYQLPVIQAARALGCFVITLDNRPENPGHIFAHESLNISTIEKETVLHAAKSLKINGIIAACTDIALPTAAYVAQKLSLVGVPLEASLTLTNKAHFREFQARMGFSKPAYLLVHSIKEVSGKLSGKEWIFKPTRSSGSRGIRRVKNVKTAIEWYDTLLKSGLDSTGILEEFLTGRQGTIEGFYRLGTIEWSFLMDRQTALVPYVGTRGQLYPSDIPPSIEIQLKNNIGRIFQELGIESCFFDADFVWNDDGATLLELTPRLGGNSIIKLVQAAEKIDLAMKAVQHCLGEKMTWNGASPTPAGVEILGADHDGVLRYDPSKMEGLRALRWMNSLEVDYPPDTMVRRFACGRDRIGEIIVIGQNRAEIENRFRSVKQKLLLKIE